MRSAVVYGSFLDATKGLDPEQFKEVWVSILEYGIDGVEPEGLSAVAKMAFELVRPNLDANKKRRKPDPVDNCEQLQAIADNCEHPSNDEDEDIDGDVDVNGDGEKKKRGARMTRPSVDEVRRYCQERKNGVDAEAFVAFYESNGWKVGKNPMRDWRACVRTWEQRERRPRDKIQTVKANRFTHGERHAYDFDALANVLSQPVRGAL